MTLPKNDGTISPPAVSPVRARKSRLCKAALHVGVGVAGKQRHQGDRRGGTADSCGHAGAAVVTFGTERGQAHPRLRAVLMTLMPLKRAVDEPCETAETWPGWPLPSKNEPPRR
ncbi:hypothetical protein D9M71_784480 [compost metagenome]